MSSTRPDIIDAKALRGALGSFATGVTIVTTCHDGHDVGLTANSFNSVSLDPPLVLWSLAKKSASSGAFMTADAFAVHVLSAQQQDLSNRFARSGTDKFAGLALERGRDGVPLLPDCAARFECRTAYRYDGGDHVIFVGEVLALDHSDKEPLLFHRGEYARKTGQPQREVETGQRDIGDLVARVHLMLTGEMRRASAALGLSPADHYALLVLMQSGPSSLADIERVLAGSDWRWSEAERDGLVRRGLIAPAGGEGLELTRAGREAVIELLAEAKAIEARAQREFEDDELELLRGLLARLLDALGHHPDDHATRHLEVMNALQADQP